MPGNSFGDLFKITTFGESHGEAVGVVIDGCPAGLSISVEDIQKQLDRRKPGQSYLTTTRMESDIIHIMSGVFEGVTTGTPILLLSYNKDAKPEDYLPFKDIFRPSHADYTYLQKYGVRDYRGSGRASARETLARVAAGAIATKYLQQHLGVEIIAYVEQVGPIRANIDPAMAQLSIIESNLVRCPDPQVAKQMSEYIEQVMTAGDSVGGYINCIAKGVPIGLGEPVFDKLHADLAKAMLSINAVKGFEIGSGFAGAVQLGSKQNDPFILKDDKVRTRSNNSGGIQGGISNGEDIYFRVAFKPVSTISLPQTSVNIHNQETILQASGRHDPCVLPRAVPIVEAMTALVIMDHYLRQISSK